MFKVNPFFIEFLDTYIHGDNLLQPAKENDPPLVLFLHGTTRPENRKEFELLRQLLLNYYSLSSCAFDCIGHGKTGGEWFEASAVLMQRHLSQVQDVVDATFDCQPFNIVAVGSSFHTAMQLLQVAPVANLVLIDPTVALPADFSVLPVEHSTDVGSLCAPLTEEAALWEPIKTFQGGICAVISAETREGATGALVSASLKKYAICARELRFVEVMAVEHNLMSFINNDASMLMGVSQAIADVCSVMPEYDVMA